MLCEHVQQTTSNALFFYLVSLTLCYVDCHLAINVNAALIILRLYHSTKTRGAMEAGGP